MTESERIELRLEQLRKELRYKSEKVTYRSHEVKNLDVYTSETTETRSSYGEIQKIKDEIRNLEHRLDELRMNKEMAREEAKRHAEFLKEREKEEIKEEFENKKLNEEERKKLFKK